MPSHDARLDPFPRRVSCPRSFLSRGVASRRAHMLSTRIWTRWTTTVARSNVGRKTLPLLRWQSSIAASVRISPALLSRARLSAKEHSALKEKIAVGYDAGAAKKVGELSPISDALEEYDQALSSLTELHELLDSKSTDPELRELAQADVQPANDRLQNAADALKSSLIPVHPFAHLPCLLEIRPGAGGDEAAIFAGDLLRMYESFCSRTGLRTNLLKLDAAEGATSGTSASSPHVQEAVLEVDSPGAYGILRCEAGVHRVQRVPATESKGRTHTSAASVLVLPSFPSNGSQDLGEAGFDDPNSDYYVDPKEVRTDVMRAGGAGGQHVNKTESAVRLTHGPTGIVVTISETRSQVRNRERAWQLLRSRIAQMRREEREEEIAKVRRGAGAGKVGRENKVRTYNYGQQRVSDHRSGFDSRNLDKVMEGDEALDKVMESVRNWLAEQEVLAMAAENEDK